MNLIREMLEPNPMEIHSVSFGAVEIHLCFLHLSSKFCSCYVLGIVVVVAVAAEAAWSMKQKAVTLDG